MNDLTISGTIITNPIFSHVTDERLYYKFYVSCKRKSGTIDILPVVVCDDDICPIEDLCGTKVRIIGQYRSTFLNGEYRSTLMPFIYPTHIEATEKSDNVNDIALSGSLCKFPIKRITPLGKHITDFLLLTEDGYYIPCIAWNSNATYVSLLDIGTELSIKGRIQSRKYLKNGIQKTAYEISVYDIKKGR